MPPAPSEAKHFSSKRAEKWTWIGLSFVVFTAIAVRLPALSQTLNEVHSFRQTQTAYTALSFHEHGISLLHGPLPILGKGDIPFEFPLFQAMASVPMSWGISPDVAMRSTALFCFALTCIALFGFTRRAFTNQTAFVAVTLFAFSPFSMQWGKASLIEFLATACAVAWAWATLRWKDTGSQISIGLAAIFGSLATTVKITTASGWLIVVTTIIVIHALDLIKINQQQTRKTIRTLAPATIATLFIPFLFGYVWNTYTDHIRANDPSTVWLTAAALHSWNYGTWHQRITFDSWRVLNAHLKSLTFLGNGFSLIAAAITFAFTRPRLLALAIITSVFAPPMIFFNLYFVHEYYFSAIAPQIAIVMGGTITWVIKKAPSHEKYKVAAFAVTAVLYGFVTQLHYWTDTFNFDKKLDPITQELRQHTKPTDRIVMSDFDWNPTIAYYARRKAEMLPTTQLGPALYERVNKENFDAVAMINPNTGLSEVMKNRAVVVAAGRYVMLTPLTLQGTETALVVSSDIKPLKGAPSFQTRTLVCDQPSSGSLTAGTYEVHTQTANQWLNISPKLAPVPVRKYLVLKKPSPAPTCTFGGQITLTPVGAH